MSGDLSWLIERDATAHGLCMWSEAETTPATGYSNSPSVREPYVYRHAFFPWPEATGLTTGDHVTVSLRADFVNADYIWSWDTNVRNHSGNVKVNYHQSTFVGAVLSEERLRKRAAGFVPEPNQDCRVDSRLLGLIGRGVSLGEIATLLLAEFPLRFKDWNVALARAADFAETYSR